MSSSRKNIAILGSTGSIGKQALEVVDANPGQFQIEILTANNNADLLIEQALNYEPNVVVIANEDHYNKVNEHLFKKGIKVYAGYEAIGSVVEMDSVDMVLTAMVGFSGLEPTIRAVKAGKDIALSNKETLVVAGEYITSIALDNDVLIIPVDSEHSAIFQCLLGESENKIARLILTASGGPFRGKTRKELESVTREDALKHPNWDMGNKITIDSATMMNKGLEVIEARWLFGVGAGQIEVVVHPQSIIHSMVEFEDGSIKAQMGLPDMRLPIQFALSFPVRLNSAFPRYNFTDYPALNFEKPDLDTFRNLDLAYQALRKGGNVACVINAANEVAVEAFLNERIGFLEISEIIEHCMVKIPYIEKPGLDDYFNTDKETRILAKETIK